MPGYRQQVEMAMAIGQPGVEPGDSAESNLVTKLLLLRWCGELSHVAARDLAHAAMLDGATHPEVVSLASTGSFGVHPGNVKRDVLSKWANGVAICQPDVVQLPAMNPKTNQAYMLEASYFQPHKLIASMAGYDEFETIFDCEQANLFWDSVSDEDPKLRALFRETGWDRNDLRNAHPLFVHGDSVEYTENDSLECCDFGPLLGTKVLLSAAFPNSCALPQTDTGTGTWQVWCKHLAKSFNALQRGVYPDDDPDKAGQPLTPQGWKFIVWALTGDHEHYANWLKLPHWSCHKYCWGCDAHKKIPKRRGLDFRPGKSHLALRTVEDELKQRISTHAFFSILGVTSFSVAQDALHILFTHGALSHLYGSYLHTLCFGGSGRQLAPPAYRMGVLVGRIHELYESMGIDTQMRNLDISMFCNVKSPHKDYPALKSKASEGKHLLPVLTRMSKETIVSTDAMTVHLHLAFKAIDSFCELIYTSPDVPGEELGAKAVELVTAFLCEYKWLNEWASKKKKKLFHMVPKFHMLWHMALDFKYLNPRLTWTFKTESYVGEVSRLAHSCCFAVPRARVTAPMCKQYRCLTHFKLVRGVCEDEM